MCKGLHKLMNDSTFHYCGFKLESGLCSFIMRHLDWMVTGSWQRSLKQAAHPHITGHVLRERKEPKQVSAILECTSLEKEMRSWWRQPGFSHAHTFISAAIISHALQTHPVLPTLQHKWQVQMNSKIYKTDINSLKMKKTNQFIFGDAEICNMSYWEFPTVLALGMPSRLWGHNEETFPQPLVAGLEGAHFLFWQLPSCSHTGSKKTITSFKLKRLQPS